MYQPEISAPSTTLIQGRSIRSCELRLERRSVDEQGQEQVAYICGASGGPERGHVLAGAGEDTSTMLEICNACPIPDAVQSRRACLNLVPVRKFSAKGKVLPVIQPQGKPDEQQSDSADGAYFTCRWFYTWYGQHQPRDSDMCLSCPYWFPRPPRELIPTYWPATRKMLRIINGEESARGSFPVFTPAQPAPPLKGWRRLLEKILSF